MKKKTAKLNSAKKIYIKSNQPKLSTKAIKFWRIAKTGFRNIFRNAWLTTAATAIMVVTLVVVSVGLIVSNSLNQTVEDITQEVSLEVFLIDNNDEALRQQLRNELANNENVREIVFISKDEALRQFQEDFADDPDLLQGLTIAQNRLPASYRVFLNDLTLVDSSIDVATNTKYSEIVDDINFDEARKASIDRIASWQDFIVISSVVAGGVFAVISVLIIFNTIRMAIYTRNYEIEIMKLIGATPGYIRGPFLFEASMYGVMAGLITLVFLYTVVLNGLPQLGQFLEFQSTTDILRDYWFIIAFVVIGTGVLIGFLSAAIAMAKYLRLKRW